jgi:hypothetical protein
MLPRECAVRQVAWGNKRAKKDSEAMLSQIQEWIGPTFGLMNVARVKK